MSTFPTMKTGAVIQYPAVRRLDFANRLVRFLDGTEQRYRGSAPELRTWAIRLDLLDEAEMAALENFFTSCQGAFGSFSFVDPWDETEYPDCSLEQDAFDLVLRGEMRAGGKLMVRQNR